MDILIYLPFIAGMARPHTLIMMETIPFLSRTYITSIAVLIFDLGAVVFFRALPSRVFRAIVGIWILMVHL